MSPEKFAELLKLVTPLIAKKDTTFRKAISPAERLAVTLRFLATGESQQSLSFSFRIGRSTLSQILRETCDAIFSCLSDTYMRRPSSKAQWLNISKDFEDLWNLPHVLGALDGKHIRIQCPNKTGSLYHNYKGFFSVVLLAVCDARYCFTMYDLRQYGSNNDSGVLAKSSMGMSLTSESNDLSLPEPETLDDCAFNPLPYYFVGDEIFPLRTWLMRPFPGKLSEDQRIFNYRLSRARRIIENTFGILVSRWRIFSVPINATIENVISYVRGAMVLHNYLRMTDNLTYVPKGYVDSETADGSIRAGDWRNLVGENGYGALKRINNIRGSRYREDAVNMREAIKTYLTTETGSVEWQLEYVRRT